MTSCGARSGAAACGRQTTRSAARAGRPVPRYPPRETRMCATGGLDDHSVNDAQAGALARVARTHRRRTRRGSGDGSRRGRGERRGRYRHRRGEEQPAVRPDDGPDQDPGVPGVGVREAVEGRCGQRRRDLSGRHQGHGQGRGVRPAGRSPEEPARRGSAAAEPIDREAGNDPGRRSSTPNRRSTVATSCGAARSSTTSSPTPAPTRPRSARTPSPWRR